MSNKANINIMRPGVDSSPLARGASQLLGPWSAAQCPLPTLLSPLVRGASQLSAARERCAVPPCLRSCHRSVPLSFP